MQQCEPHLHFCLCCDLLAHLLLQILECPGLYALAAALLTFDSFHRLLSLRLYQAVQYQAVPFLLSLSIGGFPINTCV